MTEHTPMNKNKSAQNSLPFWRRLGWTLTTTFVLLGILPVLAVTIIILTRTSQETIAQVYSQINSVSELKSDQILRWLDGGNAAIDTLLSGPSSERFTTFAGATAYAAQEQVDLGNILADAANSNNYFKRLFIYNTNGTIIASSNPADLGKSVKDQPFFQISLHADYIQSPLLQPDNQFLMYITRPLRSGKIQAVGALAGELNIATLADIMTTQTGLGNTGETYLVSAKNNYLLTPSRFAGYETIHSYHSYGIDHALTGETGESAYNDYRNPPVPVFGSYRFIPELQAALVTEVDQSQALSTFRTAELVSLGVAFVAILIALLIGYLTTQRISRPISALTISAQKIGTGVFETDIVETQRQDEIGVLARAFQKMQSELVALYESLEQRVEARTKDLAAVAEVGTISSTILESNRLLQEVVDLTTERFNLYQSLIYLLNENGDTLVLAAGAGEAGRKMVAEQRSILLNSEQSLVARAARERKGVTVNDVTQTPDFLPNPLLPNTRSELAVPMIVGGNLIGVFDIQSDQVGRFTNSDIDIQTTLAAQVATSLRNVRTYEESRVQAEFETMINMIGQKIQRSATVEETLQTAARELGTALGASRVKASIGMERTDSGNRGQ